MSRRKQNLEAPFQSISNTAFITGFATGFIRRGCKEGTIPHVKVGSDYRINLPVWMAQLNQQSAKEGNKNG